MAEKQYVVVNDQNIENCIGIDTDDLTQFQNDLDSSLSLVEVEGIVNKGWKYYSTSSNSVIDPLIVDGGLTITDGVDYSSYTYTITSNIDLASVSNFELDDKNLCNCTVGTVTLVNPTTITAVLTITDTDFTETSNDGVLIVPHVTFTADFVDTNGFTYNNWGLR